MLAVTVCGAVDPGGRWARSSASTTCTSWPTGCRTAACARSSREPGARERGHWIYEGPFSASLRRALLDGAAAAGVAVRDGGCYGHVDGPRFNTRAEIRGLAACGVTAVSQTAGPETVLCGEAELPYALLGFLTDYANGVQDEATPVSTLVEMMAASAEAFARVLRAALPRAAAAGARPAGVVYRFEAPLATRDADRGLARGRRSGGSSSRNARAGERPTRSTDAVVARDRARPGERAPSACAGPASPPVVLRARPRRG